MNCIRRKSLFEPKYDTSADYAIFRVRSINYSYDVLEKVQYNPVGGYIQLPKELFHLDWVDIPVKHNIVNRGLNSTVLDSLNMCSRLYTENKHNTLQVITNNTINSGSSSQVRRMLQYYTSTSNFDPSYLTQVYGWDMQAVIERSYINLIDTVLYHIIVEGSTLKSVKAVGIITTDKPNEMLLEGYVNNEIDMTKTTVLLNRLDYPGFDKVIKTINNAGLATKIVEEELFTDFTGNYLKQISSNPTLITDEDLEFINQTFRN